MSAVTTPGLNDRFRAMEPAGVYFTADPVDEREVDWIEIENELARATAQPLPYDDDLPWEAKGDEPSMDQLLARHRATREWEDDYEIAYDLSGELHDLYGCDGLKRTRIADVMAHAVQRGREAAVAARRAEILAPPPFPLLGLYLAALVFAAGAASAFLAQQAFAA